jgi:aryl-alcohol dehydrogenase-like predicted oxidoreductase
MEATHRSIPLRQFGKTEAKIFAIGFGGHHLGDAPDMGTAMRMVPEAVDGGMTFFDNCWEYHRGNTEVWMGSGLRARRHKVFLMTKTCSQGRSGDLAIKMLEESLTRPQTDYLDLWQIHGVSFENDPELFMREGGAAEALEQAKKPARRGSLDSRGIRTPLFISR